MRFWLVSVAAMGVAGAGVVPGGVGLRAAPLYQQSWQQQQQLQLQRLQQQQAVSSSFTFDDHRLIDKRHLNFLTFKQSLLAYSQLLIKMWSAIKNTNVGCDALGNSVSINSNLL